MSSHRFEYCSWCHQKTRHNLIKRHMFTRDAYLCARCGERTLKCRYCENMARGRPKIRKEDSLWKIYKDNWNSELCAEHDGSIASFDNLTITLDDLEDYKHVFERTKWNLKKAGLITGAAIGSGTVFGPLAFIAAPEIAAALGVAGLLGEASTGTAIITLSGAALTNASLAAMGFGATSAGGLGVVGGTALITATGAALGATQGAVISNSYFGAVEDFTITKVNEGTGGPALIFINGFLSQKNQNHRDWRLAVRNKFKNNPWYYITWEAKSLYTLGHLASKGVGGHAFVKYMKKLFGKKLASKFIYLKWASIVAALLDNPWHTCLLKSSMTGIMLADIISRTRCDEGYILMGHSLGARVIYYLLNALATKDERFIKDVYLLGGAVSRVDTEGWKKALNAVNGKLYNCYSKNDAVLDCLNKYSIFKPIGLGEITLESPKIINTDVSNLVKGHMEYKKQFSNILDLLHKN